MDEFASCHVQSYSLPDAWESALTGWLAWLIAAGTSPATQRTRRAHIRYVARSLGTQHPRDISAADLLTILARPDHSIEHRRSRRNSLASFYRWCVEQAVVEADPTLTLPRMRTPSGAPKPATDEIWKQLLATADDRTALMARLACEAGLRRAEVARVHGDDLIAGISGAELIVHGKGDKQRMVPITVSLAAAITAAAPRGGFLFPGQIDGHMSPDHVGHLVSKVMPPGWSMHKLRHRFATRGYAATGNLRAVQEALGHASVATTQRYTAVAPRDLRAVTEAAALMPSSGSDLAGADTLAAPSPAPGTGSANLTQDPPTESTFESVVSTWHEFPRCETITEQGTQCRRVANWRVNLHNCEQALWCGHHMSSWEKRRVNDLYRTGQLRCSHCSQDFARLEDAFTITRL